MSKTVKTVLLPFFILNPDRPTKRCGLLGFLLSILDSDLFLEKGGLPMDYYVNFDENGNITGYYTPELNSTIPSKCIKITEDEWKYLVINQVEYCVDIMSGNIVWCGKRIDEKVELESIRAQRNNFLLQTDWLMLRHAEQKALNITTTISDQLYSKLAVYRQQLRDLPTTIVLRKPIWPTKPI